MFEFISFSLPFLGISFLLLSIAIKTVLVRKGYSVSYLRTSISEVIKFKRFINERKLYKFFYCAAMLVLFLVFIVLVTLFICIIKLT